MWRGEEASLAEPGAAGRGPGPAWLAIGPDHAHLQRVSEALARFGIRAEPADPASMPPSITPVLCDARSRTLVRDLLADTPPRIAPILVLGVNAVQMRARLILAGADDAVSARIAPYELAARMIGAHRVRSAAQGIVRLAGFTFDTGMRQVCWQGAALPLMPREFDLLLVLARYAGLAVSRDMLLRTVWRTSFDPGTNSPEVHIFKLRQRLAALGGSVRIETVKRRGYRLVADPASRG